MAYLRGQATLNTQYETMRPPKLSLNKSNVSLTVCQTYYI